MPDPSIAALSATAPPKARLRPALVRRLAVRVGVPAMLVIYLVVAAPLLVSAMAGLATASLFWLVVALAGTVGSMVAFAALRGRTLAVGGSAISLHRTLAVSYGAGAVHTTLPAGAVFSTTYAFRHLRSSGASAAATTWSMTITGLLSTLTLSAVGLFGVALRAGTGGSVMWPAVEVAAAIAAMLVLIHCVRRPDGLVRCAHRVLVRVNRLRRVPAENGVARLSQIIDDLRGIRPTGGDWVIAVALALANWALDLLCLAACVAAVGVHVAFPALLLTYTAGTAAGSLLPLPAGLGAVETAMTVGLTVAGAAASPALAAVVLYRLLSTGSVVVIGWAVVALQRLRPRAAPAPIAPAESIVRQRDGEPHSRSGVTGADRAGVGGRDSGPSTATTAGHRAAELHQRAPLPGGVRGGRGTSGRHPGIERPRAPAVHH